MARSVLSGCFLPQNMRPTSNGEINAMKTMLHRASRDTARYNLFDPTKGFG